MLIHVLKAFSLLLQQLHHVEPLTIELTTLILLLLHYVLLKSNPIILTNHL